MALVVAVDAGTSGVRALAVDQAGAPVGWSHRPLTQHYPRPGWVEHDPDEIWTAVQATLADLLGRLGGDLGGPVAAIGVTNQRETAVLWDRRTGRPLHRAVVWQDRRTAARCDALREAGHLGLVRDTTGLVLDPYFSATKVGWLLGEGGVEATADTAFGTVDSWVLWNLSGGRTHATDPSNASRTLLYDIRRRRWSDEMCDLFAVPRACLPEVLASSGDFGPAAPDAAGGAVAGVPVTGIAGDQQAALFGQACVTPGMTKSTYGTGSFVLMNVGPECPAPAEGLLTTIAWVLADGSVAYALEGAVFATGAAVQWLRDGLGIISSAGEVEALAASVASTEGVYLVPAFAGLGSPWWDPYARGVVTGLTRGSGRAHLARAALEAMAYQTRDVVEAMRAASGREVTTLRADGAAAANDLVLQLLADQLQVPVARPRVHEATALGAAWLAGLAAGVWTSVGQVAAQWSLDAERSPRISQAEADDGHAGWRRAVDKARGRAAR